MPKKNFSLPIVFAPSLNTFSVEKKEYYSDGEFSFKEFESFLKKKLSSLSIKVLNHDESSPIGSFLTSFKYFLRDDDSFQKKIIKGLYPLITDFFPLNGNILDVGHGSNLNIMNFFKKKGFKVNGIDTLCIPPGSDEIKHCKYCSNKGKPCNCSAPNGKVFTIKESGSKRYIGSIIDLKEQGFDLIYFWGSYSSDSDNFTVSYKSSDLINNSKFVNLDDDYTTRMTSAQLLVKELTIKNCYSSLNNGGSLMIVNPCFSRHGDGYYFLKNSILDFIELLEYLNKAGFKEAHVIGYSKKGLICEIERLTGKKMRFFKIPSMLIRLFDKNSVALPYAIIAKKIE